MPQPRLWSKRSKPRLLTGHQMVLLSGGNAYLSALRAAIDLALASVHIETYWFDFAGESLKIAEALECAAKRGVVVRLVVDGAGTGTLPPEWSQRFDAAGVQHRVYSPLGRLGFLIPHRWRRLHRKLCVIDGNLAFCGGINLLDDYRIPPAGQLQHPRFDFAIACTGPLVSSINQTMLNLWWRMQTTGRRRQLHLQIDWNRWRAHHPSADFTHWSWLPKPQAPVATHVEGMLVVRDNIWHRSDIEKTYLRAIGRARHSIWLAHAYFIPSRRMRRALQLAITRGVTVHILVQGHYEGFMHHHAMRPILSSLLQMGVHVYDYAASPLHAKAAVIDGRWATVGSSNIDPLSLLLAREANVVVSDAHFATQLQQQIEHAIAHDSILMSPQTLAQRGRIKRLLDWCAYGIVRMSLWTFGVRY